MTHIFLDNSSTTPTQKEIIDAMMPYFETNFGNPSGLHFFSRQAKVSLENARAQIAEQLNALPEEIIFTSGGTESNNLALFGITETWEKGTSHLITNTIEHHSVLYPFEKLQKKGFEVSFLSPTKEGEITIKTIKNAKTKNTKLLSVMYVNNEIGTKNDIASIAQFAQQEKIIFHTDACQAVNSEDLDIKKLGIDLMTLNGSKIYGPKGVGILYKKKGIKITPQIIGGEQENNFRSGTENIPAIIGFATALTKTQKEKKENEQKWHKHQKKIEDFIEKEIPLSRINGPRNPEKKVPWNIHASFLNTEGESLILFLDEMGFAVATGSACSTKDLEPSHVLTGIGMPHEVAHGSIRITLGKNETEKQIDDFLKALKTSVEKVRKISSVQFEKKNFPDWI